MNEGTDARRRERLAAWEQKFTPLVVAAAVVPILSAFNGDGGPVGTVVDLVAWGVFLVDLAVHVRLRPGYLRTGWGVFDLVVVVGTFPWYLVPGLGATAVVGLLRLGRLVRLVVIALRAPAVHRLLRRLGAPALVVAVSVVVCAGVVKGAEGPERYPTYGDALWWAVVTVTTVGYGDYFPVTALGRSFAVVLMLVGVALLGVVAASLAAFLAELNRASERPVEELANEAGSPSPDAAAELSALRDAVERLTDEVARLRGPAS